MPQFTGSGHPLSTSKLRQIGVSTPVIALTANAMKGDDQKCFEAGCDRYLAKPVRRDVLLNTIREFFPEIIESQNEVASEQI